MITFQKTLHTCLIMIKLLVLCFFASNMCKASTPAVKRRKPTWKEQREQNSGEWVCPPATSLCSLDPLVWAENVDQVCCTTGYHCIWASFFSLELRGCVSQFDWALGYRYICKNEDNWHKPGPHLKTCRPDHCARDKEGDTCCDDQYGNETYGKFCQCPHDRFKECHVCEDCTSSSDAQLFAFQTRSPGGPCKTDTDKSDIFTRIKKSKINASNNCETQHAKHWHCQKTDGFWECEPRNGPWLAIAIHEKQHGHFVN